MMYYYENHPIGDFGGAFIWIFVILLVILLIWLFKNLVKADNTKLSSSMTNNPETATEILKKRYVKGEINKEEFDTKMKDIS